MADTQQYLLLNALCVKRNFFNKRNLHNNRELLYRNCANNFLAYLSVRLLYNSTLKTYLKRAHLTSVSFFFLPIYMSLYIYTIYTINSICLMLFRPKDFFVFQCFLYFCLSINYKSDIRQPI